MRYNKLRYGKTAWHSLYKRWFSILNILPTLKWPLQDLLSLSWETGRRTSLAIGRWRVPSFVRRVTTRMSPSSPGCTFWTRPRRQVIGGRRSSLMRTRSPMVICLWGVIHLGRCWSRVMYSLDHRCQNVWYICCSICHRDSRPVLRSITSGSGALVNGAPMSVQGSMLPSRMDLRIQQLLDGSSALLQLEWWWWSSPQRSAEFDQWCGWDDT